MKNTGFPMKTLGSPEGMPNTYFKPPDAQTTTTTILTNDTTADEGFQKRSLQQ